MDTVPKKVLAVVSQIKTFGTFGEKYQVLAPLRPLCNGDWMMHIKILDTEEIIAYCYSKIIRDPLIKI